MARDVVIASAVRTPVGSFNGALSTLPATRLGSIAIAEALKRAGLSGGDVDEVIMGNVLTAGEGQAPARQAALGAGLPVSVGATTVNKVCGSGLKAVMLAYQAIALGEADVVVAGGMENMSLTPYLLEKARMGYRMGNGTLVDSMIKDGLWDVYNQFHMGAAAEICAEKYNITREMQDEFARTTYARAIESQLKGGFKDEIIPVEVPQRKADPIIVSEDEEPGRGKPDKFAALRPAFKEGGTVTAANSSSINDGAAALVIMSEEKAKSAGIKPLARILGHATASLAPEWFTVAPVEAVNKVLERTGFDKEQVDLYEINEAFAVVVLACTSELGIPLERVNVKGGAVAMGHPIGASGARILTTLLYAMRDRGAALGCASLCIGGGEAVAMMVERAPDWRAQ